MSNDAFYELAAKVLTGEASDSERRVLKGYLENDSYRKAYEWLSREWKKDTGLRPDEFSLERGLGMLRSKIERARSEAVHKRYRMRRRAVQWAAAVLVFISIGLGYYHIAGPDMFLPAPEYVTAMSGKGERKQLTLPDGSVAYLNAGASLVYPERFSGKERQVRLEGEAFFEVVKNTHQPFVVSSGDFRTTVLGTSFGVSYADTTDMAVTVETGKVKVSGIHTGAGVILTPGNRAFFDVEKKKFITAAVAAARFTEWRKNILRFDEIPAGEAFEIMEHWYGVKVQCESEAILQRTIRGTYKNESLDNVLRSLQFMTGMKYEVKNDTITIKGDRL
ncbi:FecR family protein [Sinomicrobium soli]|uniref:FecR family protein n=1 Tax=Sinomicrobium sp. N-1-3-6 TaxID=2219864 RepID=UPI000DCCFC2B|nr:FecR domain-containing protein [Sinomicrobium sp. N-1-3-6]RAV28925.1 hypothetical protein DN748_11050 [Sinomicrobium sp. N-1-3-6]